MMENTKKDKNTNTNVQICLQICIDICAWLQNSQCFLHTWNPLWMKNTNSSENTNTNTKMYAGGGIHYAMYSAHFRPIDHDTIIMKTLKNLNTNTVSRQHKYANL